MTLWHASCNLCFEKRTEEKRGVDTCSLGCCEVWVKWNGPKERANI